MKNIRIGVAVCCSQVGMIEDNLRQMKHWVDIAKKHDVELICFPELNLTGYSIRKRLLQFAQSLPGAILDNLAELATLKNMIILCGVAERCETENKVYVAQLVIEPDGTWKVYRKLHIAPPEKDTFVPGNSIPVFETRKAKFGIQLCYDAHFPELSTYMAAEGAEIIFIPHASPRGTPESKFYSWMRHLPARAFDNGIFIIACNQTGDNGDGLQFPGLAVIIGPDGKLMKKNISGKESILIVDLKSKDLEAVRGNRMRYFLPNRRLDLFNFPK